MNVERIMPTKGAVHRRMRRKVIPCLALTALVAGMAGGCGDDDADVSEDGNDMPAVDVPTAEELSGWVLSADDLGPDWITTPESEAQLVTDDSRGDLATLDLCPDAPDDAKQGAADLQWQVIGGAGFVGVSEGDFTPTLIEVLLADEPDDVKRTFEMLRDGMTSCVPGDVFFPDAGEFSVVALEIPEVGDDRFGLRYQQTDQPAGSDRWDIRQVLVRDGAVLMWLSEIEINPTDTQVVDEADLNAAVTAAAAKLGSEATIDTIGLANPASVFCEEQGGRVEIVDEADGQVGYCELPDGRRVEEWEFFRSQTGTTSEP